MSGSVFRTKERLLGFLQSCLMNTSGTEGQPHDIPGFRRFIGELLILDERQLSVEEVMTVLPAEYQIDGPLCTPEGIIPLIIMLRSVGQSLPEGLGFSIVLEKEPNEVRAPVDGDTPDGLNPAGQSLDSAKGASPGTPTIWDRLLSLTLIPKPTDEFFEWLKTRPLFSDVDEQRHWVQTVIPAWKQHHKTSRMSGEHPLLMLKAVLPDWDGKKEVGRSEVKIPPDQRISAGFDNVVANMVLPGLARLIGELHLVS